MSVQAVTEQALTHPPALPTPRHQQSSVDSLPQAPIEEPATKAQVQQDDISAAFEDSQTTSAAPPANEVTKGERKRKRVDGAAALYTSFL